MVARGSVALIPARGGSKGISRKNLKKICGKPLISWAIETALKSKVFERVIVSTDSEEIAKLARRCGAETPFLRPANLASGKMPIEPTLLHCYEWLRDVEGYDASVLGLLMSTNPLREPQHLKQAMQLFRKQRADSVVAVSETPANHTPFWTLVDRKRGGVQLFSGEPLHKIIPQRQQFPEKCYCRNDIIYLLKPKNLYGKMAGLYGKKIALYKIGDEFDADINTPAEWKVVEMRLRQRLLAHHYKK